MVQISELKVGVFVWWTAERYMRGWSCPCVVVEVADEWFKVKSLDDFKVTDRLRMHDIPGLDESSRHEMRLCSKDEVLQYLKIQARQFEDVVAAKARYEKEVAEFL